MLYGEIHAIESMPSFVHYSSEICHDVFRMDLCSHPSIFRVGSIAEGVGGGVQTGGGGMKPHFMQNFMCKIKLLMPWTVAMEKLIRDGGFCGNLFEQLGQGNF